MNEVFFLIEEAQEGGFIAKALGESIFVEADTIEDLRSEIKDAVKCHFEVDKLPKIIRLHLVKEEVLTL
jgi:hypothetical protein